MPISFQPYRAFNLDDDRFRLDLTANPTQLQTYKNLFDTIHASPPGAGLGILQSEVYNPDNVKSLGLVSFFSRGQIEQLLGNAPATSTLRPDAVGLLATFGLSADQSKLFLMLGPSDEVGRIIPQQNSFELGIVKSWEPGAVLNNGTTLSMQSYQGFRDEFMKDAVSTPALRYRGFEKLKALTPGNMEFNVAGSAIYDAIFLSAPASAITVTFHIILRNDDTHPSLAVTPASYLTLALSVPNAGGNPLLAYTGRSTPLYTVYDTHPK